MTKPTTTTNDIISLLNRARLRINPGPESIPAPTMSEENPEVAPRARRRSGSAREALLD